MKEIVKMVKEIKKMGVAIDVVGNGNGTFSVSTGTGPFRFTGDEAITRTVIAAVRDAVQATKC